MKIEALRLTQQLKRKPTLYAFSHCVNWFRHIIPEGETDPQRMVRRLLVDKALIRDILRTANSVYYNPGGAPLASLSKAVVFLGLNAVKHIVLQAPVLSPEQEKNRFFVQEEVVSLLTAYIARAAAWQKRLDPEQCYLVGFFRRVGREILVLNAPDLYRRVLARPTAFQASLSGLVAEKLLTHWNFPPLFIEGLEGKPLGPAPAVLVKVVFLAEALALDLLEKKPLRSWGQLFETPEGLERALEELKQDLALFPPTVGKLLQEIMANKPSLYLGQEGSDDIIVPKGALILVQRVLRVLTEELKANGALVIRQNGRWTFESLGPEVPEECKRMDFKELLGEKSPQEFLVRGLRVLVLPFEVAHIPAGFLVFWRKGTFAADEYAGLKLVKRTLDGLLSHF